jgi:hypothetical protein
MVIPDPFVVDEGALIVVAGLWCKVLLVKMKHIANKPIKV